MNADEIFEDIMACPKRPNGPPPNYKGLEKLLWYIYDKKVSRIEVAKLIHVYTVAWADGRDKKILERDAELGDAATLKGKAVDVSHSDAVPL